MTTIACSFQRLEMAGDSKTHADDITFPSPKVFHVSDSLVGYAGDCDAGEQWLEWYRNGQRGRKPEIDKEVSFSGVILNRTGAYWLQYDCRPIPVGNGLIAVGTGGKVALAALRRGMSPEEAVTFACEVDNDSGPPITVLRLKGKRRGNTSA